MPSVLYLTRFPTISVGYTMSAHVVQEKKMLQEDQRQRTDNAPSRIASWTDVRVLDLALGPFCVMDLFTVFGKIVRCAMMTT